MINNPGNSDNSSHKRNNNISEADGSSQVTSKLINVFMYIVDVFLYTVNVFMYIVNVFMYIVNVFM